MKKLAVYYDNPKQGILPAFFSECLYITDPVFTFDRCMDEIIKRTGQVFKNTLFETYFPHAKKDRRLILSNGLIQ